MKKILKYKKTLIFILLISSFITYHYHSLPKQLFNEKFSKVLFASQGELLNAKIADDFQWRFPPINKVPEKYKTALVIFEDKRFNSHIGVDFIALFRSFFLNIKHMKKVSGASTISMQVIRLSRKVKTRGYSEKIKEMILALQLDYKYSKSEILALYASYAPYGGNIIGLETASWRYFRRPSNRLSWAEISLLVVLPNNPSSLHLGRNRKYLKKKRDKLLFKLLNRKKITKTQYDLSILEPLPQNIKPLAKFSPHLLNRLTNNNNKNFHYTNIDFSIQKKLLNIINNKGNELSKKNIDSLSALVIDNRNLKLLAYVGNSKYSRSSYVDMIAQNRSSGSILKPFLYAVMLENSHISPKMLIPDIPTNYNGYTPQNYSKKYNGVIPADKALARSLNIPAVRMLKEFGLNRFYDFLKELGLSTLFRKADEYGLTLILGGAEVTLWDLSSIYANFAHILQSNKEIKSYDKVKIYRDNIDNSSNKSDVNILSKGSIYLTFNALLDVKRPDINSHWKDFASSQKISWKTGTSYGFRDAWAIGVSPKYTVAVWVGNSDGEGVANLVGGKVAAPILFSIFNFLDRSTWFNTPYSDLKEVNLCKNDGYLATDLCESEKAYLPINSHFDKISPYHYLIHLDKSKKYRVNSDCEKTDNMIHQNYFVLPPIEEFYYLKRHFYYKKLPKFRKDCENISKNEANNKISIVYPSKKSEIYIPVKLDGKLGSVVFKAVHKDKNASLFWHIDNNYMGKTSYFHEKEISLSFGEHILTLIDNNGNTKYRKFRILSR